MGLKFSKHVFAYVAGIVDGEGSVCLTKKAKNENRRPVLTVPSTTFEILNWLWITFGGSISAKRKNKPHHSSSWVWALEGDSALELLKEIVPYMRVPVKIDRVKLLLLEYKKVTPRNGKYTQEQRCAKQEFERKFFEL